MLSSEDKVIRSFKTSVIISHLTGRYISQDLNIKTTASWF